MRPTPSTPFILFLSLPLLLSLKICNATHSDTETAVAADKEFSSRLIESQKGGLKGFFHSHVSDIHFNSRRHLTDGGETSALSWEQLGKDIDGIAPNEHSGWSVALDGVGETVAIGSYNAGTGAGKAAVYKWCLDEWQMLGRDPLQGLGDGDGFGYSVSLSGSGDIVAIGTANSNYVKVLKWDESTLSFQPLDTTSEPLSSTLDDSFGSSVSLSSTGKVLAVGASKSDTNGENSGQVTVFAFVEEKMSWEPLGSPLYGSSANVEFGSTVAVSGDGNVLAVGWGKSENVFWGGPVNIYKFDGYDWVPLGEALTGNDSNQGFGAALALDRRGDRVVVGAPNAYVDGFPRGQVNVFAFNKNDGVWEPVGATIDGQDVDDLFGASVSISKDGNTIAAGAYQFNGKTGAASGEVRVLEFDGLQWNLLGGKSLEGEVDHDLFGWSVALSGDGSVVAGGAYAADGVDGSETGHVRVYVKDPRPTPMPTPAPTWAEDAIPTTSVPTSTPNQPSSPPSALPAEPTLKPSSSPVSSAPTSKPSTKPSSYPTTFPSASPTASLSPTVSVLPTTSSAPSNSASPTTSSKPSTPPSTKPSASPTLPKPSAEPSSKPSSSPVSSAPTSKPSKHPSSYPSSFPSGSPTASLSPTVSALPTTSSAPSNSASPTTSSRPSARPSANLSNTPVCVKQGEACDAENLCCIGMFCLSNEGTCAKCRNYYSSCNEDKECCGDLECKLDPESQGADKVCIFPQDSGSGGNSNTNVIIINPDCVDCESGAGSGGGSNDNAIRGPQQDNVKITNSDGHENKKPTSSPTNNKNKGQGGTDNNDGQGKTFSSASSNYGKGKGGKSSKSSRRLN